MKPAQISLSKARHLILHTQGLGSDGRFKSSCEVLQHLGYLQLDTISVVERAHHHVLWSRLPGYIPTELDDLLRERKAFEYWSHAAAVLPREEFTNSLFIKQKYQQGKRHWFAKDDQVVKKVYERIKSEGPLRARDFPRPAGKKGEFWSWSPTKQALEQLFMEGRLMTVRREGFQKVYDLSERVMPQLVGERIPSQKEWAKNLILKTLRVQAFATPSEVAYLRPKELKSAVENELKNLVDQGTVVPVSVEGRPYFAMSTVRQEVPRPESKVSILSPFDHLVIQRERLRFFFEFDYLIECYTPAPKRRFGYFSLPILHRDRLVGRVDCKAHRKESVLQVIKMSLEPGFRSTQVFEGELRKALRLFATFNGCEAVKRH